MKRIFLIAAIGLSGLFLTSCSADIENMKDIRLMPIRFKPLGRNDMTLVGNLQSETTISYKVGKSGGVKLDKAYASNKKLGTVSNQHTKMTVIYFAPGPAEAAVTGNFSEELEQSVDATLNSAGTKALSRLVAKRDQALRYYKRAQTLGQKAFWLKRANLFTSKINDYGAGEGPNFAYYALVEKYPDIDYFINVRFDRKTVAKGDTYTETIIVKADGVKLKTD